MAIIVGVMTAMSALSVIDQSSYAGSPALGTDYEESDILSSTVDSSASYDPAGSLDTNAIMNAVRDSGVDSRYVFLPNIYSSMLAGSSVEMLYDRSPAPMGITDYGIMEPSGLRIPYQYSTSGFMGTAMFEGLRADYPLSGNPGTVAIQLSAVLDQVTVSGDNSHVFWVKNVMLYTPGSGQIQLVSNIWDFSSKSLHFDDGSILSGGGGIIDSTFYYYAGPVLSESGEFTVALYITSSVSNGNNEVQFQYSVGTEGNENTAPPITYDTVVFNSQPSGATVDISPAGFLVNGFSKTPSRFLYDAELAVTGPGSGSTTSIYEANGQLKLFFLGETGSYTRIPASYNFASNTGETSQGLSVWWTSLMKPMAHLSAGPSLLVSLWGSQVSHSGAVNIQGHISPANAFVFMSMGTVFDNSTAAWAPVNENGSYSYSLPGRIDYSVAVMMSNYQAQYFTMASEESENETEGGHGGGGPGGGGGGEEEAPQWHNVTLNVDVSLGVYTPLYANGNEQLKYLTVGSSENGSYVGNGTVGEPYMIENNEFEPVNTLFSSANNFLFPVFSGISITGTDSYVMIDSPPALHFKYRTSSLYTLVPMELPGMNNMNIVLKDTARVTISNAEYLTGWFPVTMAAAHPAALMILNSTDYLIASNTFGNMGTSVLIYSEDNQESNGTIWGNHFYRDYVLDSTYAGSMLGSMAPESLSVFSSGNLIYNNYFESSLNVKSPLKNLYNTTSDAVFTNDWNLPEKMPLNYTTVVNGMNLTGSIVDSGYQGGNYWDRDIPYLPFDSNGGIAVGGDYYPLIPLTYGATFVENGLPTGIAWSVKMDNSKVYDTTGNSMNLNLTNGTHNFRILKLSNYSVSPEVGTLSIEGVDVVIEVNFTHVVHNLSFRQTGLQTGMEWTVNLQGEDVTSSGPAITFARENGSYSYSIRGPQGYLATFSSGTALVYGGDSVIDTAFSYSLHRVTFAFTNDRTPGNWSIYLDGQTYSTGGSEISFNLSNGFHSYSIMCPDYYAVSPSSDVFGVYDADKVVQLSASEKMHKVAFIQEGMVSGAEWAVHLDNISVTSTTSVIEFNVPNGTYNYTITAPSNYFADEPQGAVNITSTDSMVHIDFSKGPEYVHTELMFGIPAVVGLLAGVWAGTVLFRKK